MNDGKTPCKECGERVMFGTPPPSSPVCGDCLERRTPLKREIERLRTVIRTGGAMYRAERAMMGIPGGIDEVVSEWWEVWICVPGREPVRRYRYGAAVDFRIPNEGHPTREYAREAARDNVFARIVHVVRRRKQRRKS